jgi:hypothetical protein
MFGRSVLLHAVLLAAVACCAEASASDRAAAVATIAVVDERGDELSGTFDARSDDQALWLRREAGGIMLAHSISWDRIASVTLDGKSISTSELLARRIQLASTAQPAVAESVAAANSWQAAPIVNEVSYAMVANRPPRVRSLELLSAAMVNIDRDVEPDAVAISLAPIGAHGIPMAVRGNLRATLVGQRRPLNSGAIEFGELERWSQLVRAEDFVDGVATYDLPLRITRPEWEFDLTPDALLTVELTAIGHGSFAGSAPLVIRRFNPLRDQMQLFGGSRFAPAEMHGPPPLGRFGPEQGRWQFWAR